MIVSAARVRGRKRRAAIVAALIGASLLGARAADLSADPATARQAATAAQTQEPGASQTNPDGTHPRRLAAGRFGTVSVYTPQGSAQSVAIFLGELADLGTGELLA